MSLNRRIQITLLALALMPAALTACTPTLTVSPRVIQTGFAPPRPENCEVAIFKVHPGPAIVLFDPLGLASLPYDGAGLGQAIDILRRSLCRMGADFAVFTNMVRGGGSGVLSFQALKLKESVAAELEKRVQEKPTKLAPGATSL